MSFTDSGSSFGLCITCGGWVDDDAMCVNDMGHDSGHRKCPDCNGPNDEMNWTIDNCGTCGNDGVIQTHARTAGDRAKLVLQRDGDPHKAALKHRERANDWARSFHFYRPDHGDSPDHIHQCEFYMDHALSETKDAQEWMAVYTLIWLLSKNTEEHS